MQLATLKAIHYDVAEAFNSLHRNMDYVCFTRVCYRFSIHPHGKYLGVEVKPPKEGADYSPFLSQEGRSTAANQRGCLLASLLILLSCSGPFLAWGFCHFGKNYALLYQRSQIESFAL